MIHGYTEIGSSAFSGLGLAADRVIGNYTVLADGQRVTRLLAYIDGHGPTAGDMAVRGVLYTAAGALLAETEALVVLEGSDVAWYEFRFAERVVPPAGGIVYGYQTGPTGFAARAWLLNQTPGHSYRLATDSYSDGPGDHAFSLTADRALLAYLETIPVAPYELEVADELLAALPFPDAQRALMGPPDPREKWSNVPCGWHGTYQDPELGAFAIARVGGPLEDLIGERLLVTYHGRQLAVYCHAVDDVAEDLSLTAQGFLRLALLATDEIRVKVAVIP